MARKLSKPLPATQTEAPPQTDLPPAQAGGADADAPPAKRRGPGRPSKAEVEARKEAERAAAAMTPEQFRPVTVVVLQVLATVVKGDNATDNEVDSVNAAAVAVANKYAVGASPEFVLAVSLAIVGLQMRRRGNEQRKAAGVGDDAKRRSNNSGAQGVGQDAISAGIPGGATA